ncbi:hypothetical protein J3Q64DRAFT_1707688 [Phycomyces blakesleeanus]|uniref:Uncharacterized protein n=2 Tax=Phycomyces blakesleeanus TaxID=4837 RepID=A0A162URX7_PHYB8|nr:hypothetical protein PHYBLDRAFT_164375 [Phycomyces blakesleeanus NRRL 1555(-)]OAD77463.1 hypothetical protein PHYBLDRAFT_164375 [Phycomyces blakesleeanus NRRL 1555(-)]|eukprot:XP_018295503.1 hypothetical protein PHYBLDRAFT_164375 [Phycomyces blakesleeanus NRRL 1555(-)]
MKTFIAIIGLLGLSLVNSAPLPGTQPSNNTLQALVPVSHTILGMYNNGIDPSMSNYTASASIELVNPPQPTEASEITVQYFSSDATSMPTPTNGALLATAMAVTTITFIIAF